MHSPKDLSAYGFNLEVTAPKSIPISQHGKNIVPVNVLIKSKNFGLLFPKHFAEDNILKVESADKSITITNKTSSFVDIKSISVYYDGEVSTNQYNSFELPPDTLKKLEGGLKSLSSSKILSAATYDNIVAGDAKKINFRYGIAIKYRIVDQNIDKTLYSVPTYNLYKFLSET